MPERRQLLRSAGVHRCRSRLHRLRQQKVLPPRVQERRRAGELSRRHVLLRVRGHAHRVLPVALRLFPWVLSSFALGLGAGACENEDASHGVGKRVSSGASAGTQGPVIPPGGSSGTGGTGTGGTAAVFGGEGGEGSEACSMLAGLDE